jgi:hypothetical protein
MNMHRARLALVTIAILVLLSAVMVMFVFYNKPSNQKIVCSATIISNYSTKDGPVVAFYYPDGEYEPNFVPIPQSANLSVRITNNGTITLQNITVEIKYKTSESIWNTITKTVINSLRISESKDVTIILVNPAITIENITKRNLNDPAFRNLNVTEYVLSIKDHEIAAYGYVSSTN